MNYRPYWIRGLAVYFFCLKTLLAYFFFFRLLGKGENQTKKSEFFREKGKQAKALFFALGGIYIKLGQFLGNMFHVLPEEFLWEMQELQDKVPPHPFSEIDLRWKQQFGKSLSESFDFIETNSLASASIGQVHLAIWKERKVAVKLLYPGIESQARKDLNTIRIVLFFFDLLVFRISHKEVWSQLKQMITEELNLKLEYSNLTKMKNLFGREADYFFPEPISEFCTSTTLVTEFVEGKRFKDFPYDSFKGKKNPYFEKLVKAYILMIFEYRFYHADPHPGNLILLEDGRLCFIDFGAVQSVTLEESRLIERILFDYMQRDYYDMADAFFELGAVKPKMAKENLIQILKYSMEKIRKLLFSVEDYRNIPWDVLNPGEDLRFLKEMRVGIGELMSSLTLPPRFLTLHRVLALLLGVGSLADPTRSLVDYAERPFQQIVWKGTSRWRKKWKEEGEEILASFLSLPKEIFQFLYKANRESAEGKQIPSSQEPRVILLEQFVYGILGSIFFYFGNYYGENHGKEASALFYCMSFFSFFAFAKASLQILFRKKKKP